jgi:cytidylate kinase
MTLTQRPVVAIDGPAGAGKSTVTREVARQLGYLMLDTGALYRTVGLAAQRAGLDSDDAAAVGQLAMGLAARGAIELQSTVAGQCILLDGEDVSVAIREQHIGQLASRVSAHAPVRAALLELQRQVARNGGVVAEGRDIGTVVFPESRAKFYLTASSEERAQRRHQELLARGETVSFEVVHEEVIERDRRDTQRAVAPLRQAPDATVVDSTGKDIATVVSEIVSVVRRTEAAQGC